MTQKGLRTHCRLGARGKPLVLGPGSDTGHANMVGLAPGAQAEGKRVGHGATKLLGVLLLICLFLLQLHDLRIPWGKDDGTLCLQAAAKSHHLGTFP